MEQQGSITQYAIYAKEKKFISNHFRPIVFEKNKMSIVSSRCKTLSIWESYDRAEEVLLLLRSQYLEYSFSIRKYSRPLPRPEDTARKMHLLASANEDAQKRNISSPSTIEEVQNALKSEPDNIDLIVRYIDIIFENCDIQNEVDAFKLLHMQNPNNKWIVPMIYYSFIEAVTSSYYIYNKMDLKDISRMPLFAYVKELAKELEQKQEESKVNLAFIHLVEGNRKMFLFHFNEWIRCRDLELSYSEFSKQIVQPFKNGYKGMWLELKEIMETHGECKALLLLCNALEVYFHTAGQEDEARLVSLAEVLQEDAECFIARELLGQVYYENKGWRNAISYMEDIIPQAFDYTTILSLENLFFNIAWCYGKIKDYESEEEYYRKTIEVDPNCENAMNNLGYCLYKQKRYQEALDLFEICLRENRDLYYAINNKARTLLSLRDLAACDVFFSKYTKQIHKEIKRRYEKLKLNEVDVEPTSEIEEQDALITNTVFHEPSKGQFHSEKVLEDELVTRIENGASPFHVPLMMYNEPGAYGRQYITPVGRLDILAIDEEHNYYVIELKKDSGYGDAYAQTVRYVKWIRENKAVGDQKVYGIICLNTPPLELVQRVKDSPDISLFEYGVNYNHIC